MQGKGKTTYPEESYRFVILLIYFIAAFVNSLPVHTFSSINVVVQDKFEITDTQVTLNALLFTIGHPLFSVPCNWVINKYGMRVSFIVGAVFLVSGVWLRLLLNVGQSIFCLLGSGLAAVGNIFVLNTPSQVALNWFRQDKVGIVTFTGILINLLSITVGASVPSFIIDKQSTVDDIKRFLFVEAIIVSIPIIILALLFKNRPDNAPSKAAKAVFRKERQSYIQLLKKLFRNKQYLKLGISMSFNYGVLTALIMILDQMLAGFGYEDSGKVTSITIASAMVAGILSNPLFSFLLRKTKAYRTVLALGTFGGFFMTSLLIVAYMYKVDGVVFIIILGAALGFFQIPLPSVFVSYGSQVAFPLDQSSSAGYLMAASQTFGFCIGFGAILYLDKQFIQSQIVGFIFIGILFLSFLFGLWVKEDLKKWKFEQKKTLDQFSRYTSQKSQLKRSLVVQDETLK